MSDLGDPFFPSLAVMAFVFLLFLFLLEGIPYFVIARLRDRKRRSEQQSENSDTPPT